MKYAIHGSESPPIRHSYDRILSILPPIIRIGVEKELLSHENQRLQEIHLHADAPIMLTLDGENLLCEFACTREDISTAVNYLCGGSLYAHAETIKNGYIRCKNGVRAGICGKAVTENGAVVGVSEITSINIRIPHRVRGADKEIYAILEQENFGCGILIYSAPGIGKTTVLRELCYTLSRRTPPLRFAVIDTREEINPTAFFPCTTDVFSGYPHGIGIESATRTMAPQLILCDEIGNEKDANAILKSQNCGVPLVATIHSASFEELSHKELIAPLLSARVFRYCIGLDRNRGESYYSYEINKLW